MVNLTINQKLIIAMVFCNFTIKHKEQYVKLTRNQGHLDCLSFNWDESRIQPSGEILGQLDCLHKGFYKFQTLHILRMFLTDDEN